MSEKPKLSAGQSFFILLFLLALAFAARMHKITDHGIWVDEKTSLRSAVGLKDFNQIYNKTIYDRIPTEELKRRDDILNKHPFSSADYWHYNTLHNVVQSIILDNSNSLSFAVFLHYWVDVFGTTDLAARLFSLLFGMLTLLLAYLFSRRFLPDKNYALVTVAFLVVNCWLIVNCQLVRTYAFTTFFAFLSSVLFLTIMFRKNDWWLYPLYAIAALITLCGHHMTLYIFACHALLAIVFLRDKKTWVSLVITALPVILLYGLWIGKFGADGFVVLHWKNLDLVDRALKYPDAPFPGSSSPKNIVGGMVNYLNMIMGTHFLNFGLRIFMVLGLLLVPFVLIGIVYLRATDAFLRKVMASILLIIVAAPLFCAVMAMRSHNAIPFTIFYAAYAVPLGAFLLSLCISRIQYLHGYVKYVAMALAGLQVMFILASFPSAYQQIMSNGKTPNPYMGIANQAKAQYQPGDLLIYSNWDDAQMTNLYLRDRADIQQDIDSTLKDKVVLIKGNQKIQLFDFEGGKYRY